MSEPSEHRVADPAAGLAARGRDEQPDTTGPQVSQGGSSFDDASTAGGGADAVPDTPDGVPEDNIGDSERDDYRRRGQDADQDKQDGSATASGSDVSPDPEH